YEALSYVWDQESTSCNSTSTPEIKIQTKSGITYLPVTLNLLATLKELRDENEDRYFWVEAICINQEAKAEKSTQVPLMDKIYSKATNVVVWLGDTHNSPEALALMKKIRYLKRYNQFVENCTL
ncbi:hypothetical protein AOQ84DRAFT_306705, partial [Glonium stellatum]